MQLSLLMNFAERHRRWLYLALLTVIPVATVLFASAQANAAGVGDLFGTEEWAKSPRAHLDEVSANRCDYLAMCRWGNAMSMASTSALIAVNPLMFLGTISSLVFTIVAFVASLTLQFILFMTNASFLSSLSYFVDGVFANFMNVISQGQGTSSGVLGNASVLAITVLALLVYTAITYLLSVVRGQGGFGRRMAGGVISLAFLMVLSYQAQANHSNMASSGHRSVMGGATPETQSSGQVERQKLNESGNVNSAPAGYIDPSIPKNWSIASPGWFLAWGTQGSILVTDTINAVLSAVTTGANQINSAPTSLVNGSNSNSGVSDQRVFDTCGQYVQNMHNILKSSGGSGLAANSNLIATSYDNLLSSFILTPYTISKYGPPSNTSSNSWCRDLENRARTAPGQQVLIMAQTDLYGVKSGFLYNDGDALKFPLVDGNLNWRGSAGVDEFRIIGTDGEVKEPDNDDGSGDGQGGKYWGNPAYMAARAFSPNLADVAGGGTWEPYTNRLPNDGADIKGGGHNTARENGNKYWFAACAWNPDLGRMVANDEWRGVLPAKFIKDSDKSTAPIFDNTGAPCRSGVLLGDSHSDGLWTSASGYFADTFSYKEPDNWLDEITKALFGVSMPSVGIYAFVGAPGGTDGPAATMYTSSNGFNPISALPFTIMAAWLSIASFKFIFPLFAGTFISQAIATLALCISPVLLLVSGFGIRAVQQVTRKVVGMIVTAFLTFAALVAVISGAAALAGVFRSILYAPWQPVLLQVLMMGLSAILAMQAVKLFVSNVMNIQTTSLKEAVAGATSYATGQRKLGSMFKGSDTPAPSGSAKDRMQKASSKARDGIKEAASTTLSGIFRNNDGTVKNPFSKKKPGEDVNDTIKTENAGATSKDGVPTAGEGKDKKGATATVGSILAAGGHLPEKINGKETATHPEINKPTPEQEVAGMARDAVREKARRENTVGFEAPEGTQPLKDADKLNAMLKNIRENAAPGGFDEEAGIGDRHFTLGGMSPIKPLDPSLMTEEQKQALREGRLDDAVDMEQGNRVAFASEERTQDAQLPDPHSGRAIPKALVQSGTALSGQVNENGVLIDGTVRNDDGTWMVTKFNDPTVPMMGVLSGPPPEGFQNPEAWADAGDLQQWMSLNGIDANNMNTEAWPEERQRQLADFSRNAESFYTAIGADLPTLSTFDLERNAETTTGFAAPVTPELDLGSLGFENAPQSRELLESSLRQMQEAQAAHTENMANIVQERSAAAVAARKARFDQEAAELSAKLDAQAERELSKAGKSAFATVAGEMFEEALENGHSERELNGLRRYAETLRTSVDSTDRGADAQAEQAMNRLSEAFKNSQVGDPEQIQAFAERLTSQLESTRRNVTDAQNHQIQNIQGRLQADLETIQANLRRQVEDDSERMYREARDKARKEAFKGSKVGTGRKQTIMNWFPSIFGGQK